MSLEVDTYSVNKVAAAQPKVRSRYACVKCCPNDIEVIWSEIGRSQASDIEIGDVGIYPVNKWGQIYSDCMLPTLVEAEQPIINGLTLF